MTNEETEIELRAQLANLANGALHGGTEPDAVIKAYGGAFAALGLTLFHTRDDFATYLRQMADQVESGYDPATPRGDKH